MALSGKFHHGNLRSALVQAALEAVNQDGHEKLSLRDLANKAGVSTAAPYRHFKNKGQLLEEVVKEGDKEFYRLYSAALRLDIPAKERLRQACKDYLNFAVTSPNLFRLIFIDPEGRAGHSTGEEPHSHSTFMAFEQLVSDVANCATPKEAHSITIACWSMIHGFACLRMSGRLNSFEYNEDAIIEATIAAATFATPPA